VLLRRKRQTFYLLKGIAKKGEIGISLH
jgi:hypothetical protein